VNISFTVILFVCLFCLFVCYFLCVCVVTDFSGEDKANGVKVGTVVHRRPGQDMSHFGELCSPRSTKSDESDIRREVKFRVERATVNVTLEMRRCGIWHGVWT